MSANNATGFTPARPDAYLPESEIRKEQEAPEVRERQRALTKSSLQLDEESLQKLMAILHQNVSLYSLCLQGLPIKDPILRLEVIPSSTQYLASQPRRFQLNKQDIENVSSLLYLFLVRSHVSIGLQGLRRPAGGHRGAQPGVRAGPVRRHRGCLHGAAVA